MKLLIRLCLFLAFNVSIISNAQVSYLADTGVAVFYPAHFDSLGNLPSLLFTQPLTTIKEIPGNWHLRPYFYRQGNESVVTISLEDGVDLYGTGEVNGPLRRNGTTVQLWNTDNYAYSKANGERLYQSHPWVMGVRPDGSCFGIIADYSWKGSITLNNPITFKSQGPPFRVIVIERPDPVSMMQALAKLTGYMELPPLWSLGYHQSRYSYYPQSKVLEIANEFRKRQLPADAIWMDIDYMQDYKIFTFDTSRFSHPGILNKQLRSQQFRSVYMIDPGVKKQEGYGIYEDGTNGDHWVRDSAGHIYVGKVWPGNCVFPDFTQPRTQQWWSSLYAPFMKTGADGIWNDMNEPAVFDGPDGTMPENNQHRGGGELPAGTHLRYHNVYGLLMVKASKEGIREANPQQRPFVLSRANFLGGQRYAATWTGDNLSTWQHLKLATPMVLNLGLSGQPFAGPDIGGFSGEPDPVLFAHWMAIGAYYPFFRGHASKSTQPREPWEMGSMAEQESRKALNRRYRLLPYLYTQFYWGATTGLPIMRPVFFANATDTSLRKEQEAFLLGDDLLIIPATARAPKLPKGNWHNICLPEEQYGKESVQARMLLREGSILPLTAGVIQHTAAYRPDSLILYINLKKEGTASGTLYIDAGEGYDYKKNEFEILQLTATQNDQGTVELLQHHVAGNWKKRIKYYRIALVSATCITYGEWKKF